MSTTQTETKEYMVDVHVEGDVGLYVTAASEEEARQEAEALVEGALSWIGGPSSSGVFDLGVNCDSDIHPD